MTAAALYAVPDDDVTPYPVSLSGVYEALVKLSHHPRVVNPHSTLAVHVDDCAFLVHLGRGGTYLSVRTSWDTHAPYRTSADSLFAATDAWNRERYFPTVYTVETSEHTAKLVADYLVDGKAGLSTRQLVNNLRVAVSTGLDAIEYLRQAAAKLLDLPAHG